MHLSTLTYFRLLLCFSLVGLTPALLRADSAPVISFGYDRNLPPYSWLEDGEMHGLLVDIVTETLEKQLKIPVRHVTSNWDQTVKMVKAGRLDGFIRPCHIQDDWVTRSPEVALDAGQHIFAYAGSPHLEKLRLLENGEQHVYSKDLYQWEALRPFRWVTGHGEAPFEIMQEKGFQVDFTSWNVLMTFLAKGRADAVIMAKQMGLYQINRLGLQDKVLMLPVKIDQTYCFFINNTSRFHKKLPKISQALQNMKQDGVIKKIEQKHLQKIQEVEPENY